MSRSRKEQRITSLFAVIGGKRYRCVRSHSCSTCAFVQECYAFPRKKRCPTFGGQNIAMSLNVVYRRADPGKDTYYVIADGSGTYYQGANYCTEFLHNATLFRNEAAAECVRQDLEQRLHHGRLTVIPVSIIDIITKKGVK